MRYLLYLTCLFGVLPAVLVSPFHGLCVYYIVSFMQPKILCWKPELQDSLMVGLPLVVGACLWGVQRRMVEPRMDGRGRIVGLRDFRVRNQLIEAAPLIVVQVLLVLYCTMSRLVAQFPLENNADEYWRLVKIVLVTMLMTGIVSDSSRARVIYGVVAFATGFWPIKGGAWVFLIGPHQVYGADYDNNLFALKSIMVLPMMYYFGMTLRNRRYRTACYVCCALTCLAIIGSGSRSAFAALPVVLGCIAWTSGHRVKAMSAVALVACIAIALSWNDITTRFSSIVQYRQDKSLMTRLDIWNVTYEMLERQPLIGVGFSNFEQAYQQIRPYRRAAHNIYLQNLAELGIVGHPLFLILVFGTIASLYGTMRRARTGPPELRWCYDLSRGLLLGMIAYCIHGMFHNDEYLDLMFCFVGFAVTLRTVYRRERMTLALESAVDDPSAKTEPSARPGDAAAKPAPVGSTRPRLLAAGRRFA